MSTSSTSLTTPVTVPAAGFTGVSKFASSLQQVLSRAVSIASLPLDSLESGLTTLQNQQTAVQGLDSAFTALQSSISALDSTVSSGLLEASVADGSIASATVASSASPGTYTLEVDNLGSSSTALSIAGSTAVSDPTSQGITSASSVTLTVGNSSTVITPTGTTLEDLANAINSEAGSQVQATIVNVGSSSSPDYRLSLSAVNLGTDAIGLADSNGNNLIQSSTQGQLASYQVDGTTVSSSTRRVTISPGLTVTLLGQSTSGQPTTVTVQDSPEALASAFSSFAQAYNSAVSAVSAQRGQNAGTLQGDSLITSLTGVLSQLVTYNSGSPNDSLANFGITVDSTGVLSVDTATFTSAAAANFEGLLTTLGGATTGGFLEAAANLLSSVEDPTTGSIKTEESSLSNEISTQQTEIANEQNTVNQLQSNLTAQISAADTAIAGLENQVTFVTGLFAQYTGATNTQANGVPTL
ncbi:MAG TPA: flagellar filament capping protein FliD [Bryobacteraceae bacterium]|nr:flagellar filament capping protein FliD [Bryobacteraceae bacterium]